jgi:hypothetical protein
LPRVEVLTKQAGEWFNGVRIDDTMARIRDVCKNDPMGSVGNEATKGNVFPRMNSAMPAMFMAIPPKK